MHVLWVLFYTEARYRFKLLAQHISGTYITLANQLSRNQVNEFYRKLPSADRQALLIPFSPLQWLLDTQIDWISEYWTQLFTTFVNKEWPQ